MEENSSSAAAPEAAAGVKRGRPRDEAARQRILAAARAILAAQGLAGLTMQAIARQARVSKQTIYLWWPSRGAVALDALTDYASETIDTGPSAHTGLLEFLQQTFRALNPATSSTLRALMAEAQLDPHFADEFRSRLVEVRRNRLKQFLMPVVGEDPVDLNYAADVIYGVMWYRLLIGHGPLDDALAERLVRSVSKPGMGSAGAPAPPPGHSRRSVSGPE